ncbi:MAG: amidohydrolase [Pseudomonadales bacterium]|nr:amidohydrolase [Pseudomonadales bacterium]
MDYKRISADCHIDLCWLPGDLFTSEAKGSLKERMPYVTEDKRGLYWTCKNGGNLGLKNGVGPSGAAYVPGQHARVDAMAATNLYSDGQQGISRIADPDLRIKDMERDGVDAEVIYGILGIAGRLGDHEAANEMFRIYNDWLVNFCSHYPDRHIGLACLPYGDIDAAVAEVYRAAKMGLKGVELSCSWDMQPMWHTCWEPLWQAVNEVDLPIHFHTFPNVAPDIIKSAPPERRRSVFFTIVSGFQLHLVDIIGALMSANVFERYPNYRVVFGESGIGWIPYVLDRMDFEWEDRFQDLGLKMKPSEYWRRQCRGTFQYDKIGCKLIDDMGIESLMWGSDYPHGDGVWPESTKFIEDQFANLTAAEIQQITCDNAKAFYRL